MDSIITKKQIFNAKNQLEKSVLDLFQDMDFNIIDTDSKIYNSQKIIVGELDILASLDDYLFLVEVNGDSSVGSKKSITFFSIWSDETNLELINKKYQLRPMKVVRLYFDFTKNSSDKESAAKDHHTDKNENIVVYHDDFEYFLKYVKKVGSWAKNDFINYLNVSESNQTRNVDAIQYYIGNTPVFAFVERVDRLLKTCYVSRKRGNEFGYQRTLNENRITGISKNILGKQGLSFPNSILINTPKLIDKPASKMECPKPIKIQFPQDYSICRIIDGQHRLLGFSKLSTEIQKSYFLPVIALQEYDRKDEIRTFIDINSQQQKIDRNLILSLISGFEWNVASNPKEYKLKIAVDVSSRLNEKIFKDRIFFGRSDEPHAGKITLSTLVSAMIKNDQIRDTYIETFEALSEVFSYLGQYLHRFSFKPDTYFGQNNGIRVLFRLIRLIQRNISSKKINTTMEVFFQDLGLVLDEKMVKQLESYYGEAGVNLAVNDLIEIMKKNYGSKYENMKTDLKSLR